MATVAHLNVLLGMKTSGFYRDLQRARYKVRRFGRELKSMGAGLTANVTRPLLAAGAASTFLATRFDASMTKIVSLVGVNRDQVDAWRKDLLALGPSVGKSAKELADGLFFVTSAGLRGAKAMEVLTASAKASAIGLGSTATVADAVTSALNAYGTGAMSAGKATAILVAAVREGKASADAIAPALGRVLPVASQLGVGFDQVAASIAAMTRIGLDASESATALRAILGGILKPSGEASRALASVGLSAAGLRQQLASEGLLAVLGTLRQAFAGNNEALAQVFGNIRGLTGVLSLTGKNAAITAAIFRALAHTTAGDLGKAFKVVAGSPSFKMQQALISISNAGTQLGGVVLPALVPVLDAVVQIVQRASAAFAALPASAKKTGLVLAGLAVVVGPLLTVLGTVATAVAALGAPLAAGIAATVAAVGVLAANWKKIGPVMAKVWAVIQPILIELKAFGVQVFNEIAATAKAAWPDVQAVVVEVLAAIHAAWVKFGQPLLPAVRVVWEGIKTTILVAVEELGGAVRVFLKLLRGDFTGAMNAASQTASRVWKTIADNFRMAILLVKVGFAGLRVSAIDAFLGILVNVKAVVKAFVALPFIDPGMRAIAAKGLEAINTGIVAMGRSAFEAKKRYLELNAEAAKAMSDAAGGGLVQKMSGWFTTATEAATEAAKKTSKSWSVAGKNIEGSLSGGFGVGIEKGIKFGDQQMERWRKKVRDKGLEIPIRLNFDEAQRQIDDFRKNHRAPKTGGEVP